MTRRDLIKQGGMATIAVTFPFLFNIKNDNIMSSNNDFEVIIIGGSYAGLSAAMALGRSMRKVLIIDSGSPCNKQTPHSHNFITQDGIKPNEISTKAKIQVLKYNTVEFIEDKAIEAIRSSNSIKIVTESGKTFDSKKVIFATGIKDTMPNVKGFSECWGISVVHCPYCHGYEIRHKKTGIIASGEKAIHLASLVNNLTNDITILTSGKGNFEAQQIMKLKKHKIKVIEKEVSEIEHINGYIKNIVFSDKSKQSFEAVYAAVPFTQHSGIPESLGCQLTEQGFIQVDMMGKTTIENIFACGDNCSRMRSVANAVATGNMVGAAVNMELTHEQF